jgi:exopolysaccharide biosynthesis polyprenyl glycosylphosphotransferase
VSVTEPKPSVKASYLRSSGLSVEPGIQLAPPLAPPAEGVPDRKTTRRRRLPISLRPIVAILGLSAPYDEAGRAIREGDPRAAVARRDAIFRRSLAVADLIAAAAALTVVTALAGASLRPLALLALPLVVLAGKLVGLYDRDELLINRGTLDEAPRLMQLATLYTLLFVIFEGAFVRGDVATGEIVLLWVAIVLFALFARTCARGIARSVTPTERCLLVGTEESGERLRTKLAATRGSAVLVGRVSPISDLAPLDATSAASMLRKLVDELDVHRVIIEPSEAHPQATLDFVREAKGVGTAVSLLPRILEVVGSSIEIDDVHGVTLLGVRRFGLSRSSMLVKRSFDLVGAALATLALAPLMALVALLIRLDSSGPVVYRQTRVGRGGSPFSIWKFRTMVVGADALKPSLHALNEADGLFKIEADPRITRVGRSLRRHSLDELPQLFNVLRGEMSLVGPRPLVRDDDERITGSDRRRLQLTPGMTGPWQILGSSRIPMSEMIKLDYLYVTGWSLWSDVKILLRTVPYVLARRGM